MLKSAHGSVNLIELLRPKDGGTARNPHVVAPAVEPGMDMQAIRRLFSEDKKPSDSDMNKHERTSP